jgi:FKBP-type peptidyl-prolyl cis-trans isomerase
MQVYKKITMRLSLLFSIALTTSCQGDQAVVKRGDEVRLIYKMQLTDGMRVDESSLNPGFRHDDIENIFSFKAGMGEVIAGWDSVVIGCKKNKLYQFNLPAQSAYGNTAVYHDIPAGSELVLTFKITDIR